MAQYTVSLLSGGCDGAPIGNTSIFVVSGNATAVEDTITVGSSGIVRMRLSTSSLYDGYYVVQLSRSGCGIYCSAPYYFSSANCGTTIGESRHLVFNSNSDIDDSPLVSSTWQSRYNWWASHGGTAVQVVFRWYDEERTPGNYNWSALDAHVNYIANLGMKASVVLDITREDQSSIGNFRDFTQFFPDGHEMKYQDGSQARFLGWRVNPSFSSSQGMSALNAFFQRAATHLDAHLTSGKLLHVGIRFGDNGEQTMPGDISNNACTDYSAPSISDFRIYLTSLYGNSIGVLNDSYGTSYPSFNSVPAPCPNNNCSLVGGTFDWNSNQGKDWMRFRWKKQKEVFDTYANIMHATNASFKVMYLFAGIGLQQATFINACTNIAYLCQNADYIYSSAGDYASNYDKVLATDLIMGTFPGKFAGVEFDTEDVYQHGNYADLWNYGSQVFDRGGQCVYLALFSTTGQLDSLAPYLAQLSYNYCIYPNASVSPRNGYATYTYNSSQLYDGSSPAYNTWIAHDGDTTPINLVQINDVLI